MPDFEQPVVPEPTVLLFLGGFYVVRSILDSIGS